MRTVYADKQPITIKGAKKQPPQPRKPVVSKDTAASTATAKILYGLAEGEIEGLVDGGKSIFLEGTPLLDSNGNNNFENVKYEFRSGTNDQTYIKGFPDVSNETPISVELKGGAPWIRSFTDTQISAVRVRLKWDALSSTNEENGDVNGVKIEYAIDLQVGNSPYQTMINTKIEDKTSSGYQRTHRINLPRSNSGWQIRVRRLTPNSENNFVQDTMYIDAVAEVIDVKLRYPNTALLGLEYDSETFNNIAKIAVHLRGSIIRVPTNYNATTRAYIGIWDGTFKDAYSNNPAWVYYDLCMQWRYGLGERLDALMIDKWSLYTLAQYCDQKVSNGQGGLEPRFTCNVYLQSQVQAFTVLSNIAGIFRAMSYWNGSKIVVDADTPQDPVYTFNRANVIDGAFEYTGTRQRDRHTVVKVAWDNPKNSFETEYEFVRDELAMAKFGVQVLDLSAFGCTSQSQAQRTGLWALKTEQLETRQVSFAVGLDGFIPQVGNIINVSDELFMGRAIGGRVSTVNGTQRIIELDRELDANIGDVLIINSASGKSERRNISNIVGNRVTVTAGFTGAEPEHVWVVETPDLKLMRFRVMSIAQNDDNSYNITAIQHDPSKYVDIDTGANVRPDGSGNNNQTSDNRIDAPTTVTVSARYKIVQAATVATLVIDWSQVPKAITYDVEYRKDSGSWIKLPRTANITTEVEGIFSGIFTARVRAVSPYGIQSAATESVPTLIKPKADLPPPLFSLFVTGILFGMYISWSFDKNSDDIAYTEIEEGTDPNVNVKQLGMYAYPTDSVTIQGLPPNLTLFYRARLVDKFGVAGEWTDWKEGMVSADAQAVLDLLNEKISNSQLDQDLQASIGSISDLSAAILDEDIVRVDDLAPLVQRTTTAQTTAQDAKDASITNRASIQQQLQSINGLYAQYTIKVDVNGRISGFGLASSPYSSTFAIRADEFYIAPPNANSGSAEAAFIYRTTPYTDPNSDTVVPAGLYLKDAFIANASMTTAKIQGQAVTVTSSATNYNSSSSNTIYLNSGGGTILLRANFYGIKGSGSQTIYLYRNGALLTSFGRDSGGVDSYTESFEVVISGSYGTDSFTATWVGAQYVRSTTITATSLKR